MPAPLPDMSDDIILLTRRGQPNARRRLDQHGIRKLRVSRTWSLLNHSQFGEIDNHLIYLVNVCAFQTSIPRRTGSERQHTLGQGQVAVHHRFVVFLRQNMVRDSGRPEGWKVGTVVSFRVVWRAGTNSETSAVQTGMAHRPCHLTSWVERASHAEMQCRFIENMRTL